jgi:hypothetical protein
MENDMRKLIDQVKNFGKSPINEDVSLVKESNFDFSNNSFVRSMNLTPTQIGTLQDIINLMLTDEHWVSEVYPDGYWGINKVILDVTYESGRTGKALDLMHQQHQKNPMTYVNKLKSAIKRTKGIS